MKTFLWEICQSIYDTIETDKSKENEPPRDKMACAASEDSDQPGLRVFAVRINKACVLSYPLSAQRRLWSDWADAQADLSLHCAHMLVCWFCHEAAQITMASTLSAKQATKSTVQLKILCHIYSKRPNLDKILSLNTEVPLGSTNNFICSTSNKRIKWQRHNLFINDIEQFVTTTHI